MKIIDVGHKFHMAGGHVFKPWKPDVVRPQTIKEIQDTIEGADLMIFGGGSDIHPSLYGHANVATGANQNPSVRDLFEVEAWKLAISSKVPILGICRGAQLACALSGGSLIQDVRQHAGGQHSITTNDGKVLSMSSLHHQMMYPGKTRHIMLAWATENLSTDNYVYDHRKLTNFELKVEPEAVFFPETMAVAVQGHPEFYNDPFMPAVVYTREIVNKYLCQGKYPNV